ncbi:MAG: alpha/beta hydrolase [Sphingomonas sp.]
MLGAALLGSCGHPAERQAPADAYRAPAAQLSLRAKDGATVYAARYGTANPKAVILLFHQAGSSKEEYSTIAPRLAAAGYEAVAVDARAGGGLFGTNETARALGHQADYLEARQDLQAAVDWAKTRRLPVIAWGSSYSSSLVFPLAVESAGVVKAVLAFSPGEYFADKAFVAGSALKLSVPAYITSAPDKDEVAAASRIAHAVPRGLAVQYVPRNGVHGSSTLIAAKDPKGAASNWMPVMSFLKRVAP